MLPAERYPDLRVGSRSFMVAGEVQRHEARRDVCEAKRGELCSSRGCIIA
jgi:hypothetical protein